VIDVATRGTSMNITEDKTQNLIEEMTLNNYQWFNERTPFKKVRGKFDVNALTLLTTKIDVVT